MQIFPNLVTNDYKSHVVVNGVVTFWMISTSASFMFVFKTLVGSIIMKGFSKPYLFLPILMNAKKGQNVNV